MKRNIRHITQSLFCLLLLATALTACHEEYDDYYTTATISFVTTDGTVVERMQGTVTVTNLSNGQSYASSNFDGASTTIDVLRGPYSIAVEGSVQLKAADGTTQIHTFRASTSYCELMDHPSIITLNILLLT